MKPVSVNPELLQLLMHSVRLLKSAIGDLRRGRDPATLRPLLDSTESIGGWLVGEAPQAPSAPQVDVVSGNGHDAKPRKPRKPYVFTRYDCPYCQKKALPKGALQSHIKRVHPAHFKPTGKLTRGARQLAKASAK